MMSSINSNKKRKLGEHQPEYHHHQSVKQEENNCDEFLVPLIYHPSPRHDQQHLVTSSDDILPQGGGGLSCRTSCNVKEEEEEEKEEEDIIAVAEREYERLTRIAEEQNHTFLEMEEQQEDEEHNIKEEEENTTTTTNEEGGMMTMITTEEDKIEEVEIARSLAVDNRPNKRSRVEPDASSSSKESREKQRGGRFSSDESSFDELMMGKLREYQRHHGTTDVYYIDGIDSSLYDWVCSLKEKARKGTLPQHHESQLKDLGFFASTQSSVFPSAPSTDTFEVWMNRLGEYKKLHGTANVCDSIDRPLYCWLYDQKLKHRRKGNLPKEYALVLEDEGVDLKWRSSRENKFGDWINQLREYKEQYGTAEVSKSIDQQLWNWLYRQKVKHSNGTMSKKHASMLEDEGVELKYKPRKRYNHKNRKFDEWINQLREYKKRHGTANVSRSIDSPLCGWLCRQKVEYRNGTLPKELASVLEDEGVDLKCKHKKKKLIFEEQIEKLREYKKQHGTSEVSQRIDKKLWNWLYKQKVKHRQGTLSKEHTSILQDLLR